MGIDIALGETPSKMAPPSTRRREQPRNDRFLGSGGMHVHGLI